MTFLSWARRMARSAGLEVQRAGPLTLPFPRLCTMLKSHNIENVLDVGANDGGYASELFASGYDGRVISFEPLPDAWNSLKERASRHPRWEVGRRVALSDVSGAATFYEAGNSVSSSLLPVGDAHVDAAPTSRSVREIEISTTTLDEILPELQLKGETFLKLDTQGSEHLVLRGAHKSLGSTVRGVQLEMSLTGLYKGQELASELDAFLRDLGFVCWDMIPGFRDPRNYRLLQYDGLYFR